MNMIYRYNRNHSISNANLTVTDSALTAIIAPSVPDPSYSGDGDAPLVAGAQRTLTISLEELKALKDFDDGAMLSFDINSFANGGDVEWRNLYIGTYVGRRKMLDYINEIKWNTAFRILVPASGIVSMRQCKYIVQMENDSCSLTSSDQVTQMSSHSEFSSIQFVPKITGPDSVELAATDSITYSLQLEDSSGVAVPTSGTVYLEATGGTLAKNRIELNASGQGSFRLIPTGLQSGDSVKIKAGFRYYPGVSDKFTEFQ